ncbi:MAG: carboxypeptidase-like regulatory domain-containing protein [Bacteroidota bacterium]
MRYWIVFWIFGLVLIGEWAIGQEQVINGKIVNDDTRLPISDVAVLIDQTGRSGVSSDENGTFILKVNQLPLVLSFSHVGYEPQKVSIENLPDSTLLIQLTPQVHLIEETVITAPEKTQTLSDAEQYSVIDFELMGSKILMLQFFGTFKNRQLSLMDLNGKVEEIVVLKEMKHIDRLYKGCEDIVYLLTNSEAIPIVIKEQRLKFLEPIRLKTFNDFVQPCRFKHDNSLYYLFKEYKGLKHTLKKYVIPTAEVQTLKVVLHEKLNAYFSESLLRNKRVEIDHIFIDDWRKNAVARDALGLKDFLANVFYVPKYPVHIFLQEEQIILLDHPAQTMMIFGTDELAQTIEIDYPKNKKWVKKIIQDEKTQQLFGLFDCKQGTALKLLHTPSGELTEMEVIDAYSYHLKKVRMYDQQLFYLKENRQMGSQIKLMRQNIGS